MAYDPQISDPVHQVTPVRPDRTPAPGGRPVGAEPRWSSRTVLALVACVVIAAVLTALVPKLDPFEVSYADPGRDGWAASPDYRVRLGSVALTKSLDVGRDQPLRTDAVFVVVTLEAAVTGREAQLTAVSLQTADGRTYAQRTDQGLKGLLPATPGFTSHGTVVFEVPPARVPGAAVVVGPEKRGFVAVLSGAARLPDATAAAQEVPAVKLPEPTVVVTR